MPIDLRLFLVPASIAVGGVIAGLVLERMVLARLRAHVHGAQGSADGVLIHAIRGQVFLWCALLGTYLALRGVQLAPETHELLGRILTVAMIVSVTVAVARLSAGFGGQLANRSGGVVVSSSIFTNLLRIVVFLLGALMIMQSLGISVTPVLTALGVGGLAVALALQDPLGNFFAGLQILIAKKIRPGDYIRIDSGLEGTIEDVAWRNTTLRTGGNNLVVVPNLKLASAIVTNFTLPEPEMALVVPVGIGFASDLAQVERLVLEVARQVLEETGAGVPGVPAVVRFQAFAESSILLETVLRVRNFDAQGVARHAFIKALHARFRQEGIEIPYPARTVHLVGALGAPVRA